MKRLGLLEVIAGAYATQILLQLSRSPLARELTLRRRPAHLACRHRLDPHGLQQLLEFLALTTETVEADAGAYRWRRASSLAAMRFQLEKFEAAYGGAVGHCLEALRCGRSGRCWVDRSVLAGAFALMGESVNQEVIEAIERARIDCLLDLGCGTGALLRALARRNPRFTGIGVDAHQAMCREARRATQQADLSRRIRTLGGPAPAVLRLLRCKERENVQALHGASFLNEFFRRGPDGAVRVLRKLGRLFPGRRAWFVDYHGWLGTGKRGSPPLVNVLQDVAQIVSGQGVPPPDAAAWERVYRGAGCQVFSQRTFRTDATEWCLHEVRLPGQ